jgi:hypothetical protein
LNKLKIKFDLKYLLFNLSIIREKTEDDLIKKKVYTQAKVINKACVAPPKIQRLHENVSKVFGMDDPPAGFGNCYPRYYFLEQHLQKPISPLKVFFYD